MIKAVRGEKMVEVEVSGSLLTVSCELVSVAESVYTMLSTQMGEMGKELFAKCIEEATECADKKRKEREEE